MTLLALAAGFIVSLATWISASRSRRVSLGRVAALATERMGFAVDERAAQARIATAEKAQHTAVTAVGALRAPKTSEKSEASKPRLRTQSEIIASSPALELLELQRQRAAANQEYRRFFQRVNMTPEEGAKFCELKMRHAENWMDVKAAARAQGDAGRETIARLQAELKAAHEAALADLLGPERFRQLQEFDQSVAAYNVIVRGLAGATALEGIPLTSEQGERLIAAAASASRGTTTRGEIDLAALDWAALEMQARQILTPAQFAIFRNVEAPSGFQGRWTHEFDAALRRAFAQEQAGTASPNPKRND
jgi:hypothetical protein